MERRNTNCVKWVLVSQQFGTTDILPMWVADMDLSSPPEVVTAIKERANHPVYGYTIRPDSYYQAFIDWIKGRHDWEIDQDWLVDTPGVVPAMAACVQEFTDPGDKILVQTPVYYPFYNIVKNNGRQLVTSPLLAENGVYTMDFSDLRQKFVDGVKMILLCSPHNPVGRVWTEAELRQLGELCLEYNVKIISDEIWSDLVFLGHNHLPIASLSQELAELVVTCMAPSKTFNIAGLNNAIAVIPNDKWRRNLNRRMKMNEMQLGNVFAIAAFEAAYSYGASWLTDLLELLKRNRDYVVTELSDYQGVEVIRSEGTYLLWIDFRSLGVSHSQIEKSLVKHGKVGLSDGRTFGKEGDRYFRMNIGCQSELVAEGTSRIKLAIDNI